MARLYKFAFVAITAGFAGIWLGHALSTHNNNSAIDQKNHSLSIESHSNTNDRQQLQRQIQQLQSENHQLKKQLEHDASHSSLTSTVSTIDVEQDDNRSQLASQLQALEMEKQQRKAVDVVNWIKQSQNNNRNFDLNNELSMRFEQESRDPAWAEQQENHYHQLFTNDETLSGIALRNTQCRSSQCEITIGVANTEQSNQLLQTITKALASDDHPVSIMVATDERSGTSKLYISNNEDAFAFN